MTLRAIILGLLLAAGLAAVVPVNDWYFRNTFFYSQHLPIGVLLLVVLFTVVVNPILGRRRLLRNELLVITGMLLVLGGVASSGLNRILATTMSGPAHKLSTGADLQAYVRDDGSLALPRGPYVGLESGQLPDPQDPEFQYVVDGFWLGLQGGDASVGHRSVVEWRDQHGRTYHQEARLGAISADFLDLDGDLGRALRGHQAGDTVSTAQGRLEIGSVQAPPIPWGVWGVAWLHWLPIILPGLVGFLALGALVRKQWLEHERLPYPIAGVIADYLADPEPGQRWAPIFRQRSFWVAFTVVAVVLLSQLLAAFSLNPIPIPTTVELTGAFRGQPWTQVWNHGALFTWRIYFSIIALTFLLPPALGFSLWSGFVVTCVVPAFLAMQGFAVGWSEPSQTAIGGYAVMCLLILWIGRHFYLRVLATAVGLRRDPALREEVVYAWALVLGIVGMVGGMVWYGAYVHHALIATAVYLGTGLVLARFVAEAGIPYINSPTWWTTGPVIYSLTGFAAPLAALVPLGMLAQTLCADPREHVIGFAINAEALGERAGAPRLPLTGLFLLVTAGGAVIALAAMLVIGYRGGAMTSIDDFWHHALMGGLGGPAQAAEGGDPTGGGRVYWCYAVGAMLTAILGLARLKWAWWPLHPIGLLLAPTWATSMIWFSFFLGWMWKAAVMRYGGIGIYRRCRPIALGLIAGEAAMVGLTLFIGLIARFCDYDLPVMPKFLPW